MGEHQKGATAKDVALELLRKSKKILDSMPDDKFMEYAPVVFDMCYKITEM